MMADDICFNGLPELDFDAAAHYGIKDQKWGIRNYQYENGSYTPAGRERYRRGNGERRGLRRENYNQEEEPKKSLKERFIARVKAEPGIIAKNIVKKHIPVFALKDDELRNINERLQLEESVLHLSGRLSPQDHRRTTHSVFTGLLNASVHTLDSIGTSAAKAMFSSHGGGGGGSSSGKDDKKYKTIEETVYTKNAAGENVTTKTTRKEKIKHDGLDLGVTFTGLPDLDENFAEHFGLLGMKWGVRRWQNPDGTLTPEGKERYYGSKEQKSLLEKVSSKPRNAMVSPQVNHAVASTRALRHQLEYLDNYVKFAFPSEKKKKMAQDDYEKLSKKYDKAIDDQAKKLLGEYANEVVFSISPRSMSNPATTTILMSLAHERLSDLIKVSGSRDNYLGDTPSERMKRFSEPWPEIKDLMKKYE